MQPTERFSSRVQDYVSARPGYPPGLIETLRTHYGLKPADVLADIGSGTGILTQVFLKNGNEVFGVEPNQEMRTAAERFLAGYSGFHSINGRAENTSLPAQSVQGIVCGQAFHWFEPPAARTEFVHILRPSGWVMLAWNERVVSTPFLREYEDLLKKWSQGYGEIDHHVNEARIASFFAPSVYRTFVFPNHQMLDRDSFERRIFSKSFMPRREEPNAKGLLQEADNLFQRHHNDGKIRLDYETKMFCGEL